MVVALEPHELENVKDILLEISVGFEFYKEEISNKDLLEFYLDSNYVKNLLFFTENDRLKTEAERVFDLVDQEVKRRITR